MLQRLLLIASIILAPGCGPSSNILGILTPQEHKETFENALEVAQAAYDQGDMKRAEHYARMAYDMDHDSERAAVLFGFVSLSLAGGDPYRIADALIAGQKSQGSSSGGTADTLGVLKPIIGLNDAEFAQMGTKDTTDPDLPIIVPHCAEDVRAAIAKLGHINDAIVAVCPFVDDPVHIIEDTRQYCKLHVGPRLERAKSHFLWAFAHLTEALAFDSVLTYGNADPTGKKTNLELRVEKIHNMDTTAGLDSFLTAMSTLNTTLQAVMPTSGSCSPTAPTTQLRGTLDDMLAVDAAFGVIPGTPASVKASIQKAMARIKTTQSSTASGSVQSTPTEAMKGDFTKKMSKSLADKLDSLTSDPNQAAIPADKKTEACAAYATIAAGSGQTSQFCSTSG